MFDRFLSYRLAAKYVDRHPNVPRMVAHVKEIESIPVSPVIPFGKLLICQQRQTAHGWRVLRVVINPRHHVSNAHYTLMPRLLLRSVPLIDGCRELLRSEERRVGKECR